MTNDGPLHDAILMGISTVLLLGAAVLSLAVAAITRVGRAKAHHLSEQKKPRAALLVKIVEDPAPYLTAALIARVAAYVSATAIVVAEAIERFGSAGKFVGAALLALVIILFSELIPRTLAVHHTEGLALVLSAPVFALGKLLKPVTGLFIFGSNLAIRIARGRGLPKGPLAPEDEIRDQVDDPEEEIEEEERELIHSIFEFGDTIVREVMVPRPDMITVPSDATLDESLGTIIKAGYSRIPIYEGDTDNIVGVLYAKDVLKRIHESKGDAKVSVLSREPLFVPEQKKVAELLREMQHQRVHMAIVVDEYGGTAGLATIEDLLEEIVGEIVDEYDQEEPLVEPIDDVTIRVDAKMPIDEVNELLEVELPHDEWDTVGGLVFGIAGKVPLVGETVTFDSLEFVTERVTGRRIKKVVIRKTKQSEATPR